MKNYDIFSLVCLNEVFLSRSLTKAAAKLGISKVAVSRRLTNLESEFGEELFIRTTRFLKPTSFCESIMVELREVLGKIENLYSRDHRTDLDEGVIRVSCISSMTKFFTDLLCEFQIKYPKIKIELIVTDSILNLIEHNIDLTLRVNPDSQSSLVGKKVGHYRLHVVASPAYLKKQKPIRKIDDLLDHNFFTIDSHLTEAFGKNRTLLNKLEEKRVFKSNDSATILKSVMAGYGIGLRSNWDLKFAGKEKKLVELLPGQLPSSLGEVWLLAQPKRSQIHRVRLLYEFLLERIAGNL